MKRMIDVRAGVFALAGVLGTICAVQKHPVVHAASVIAPRFEVDPFWPKPLPDHWVTGSTIGVAVDAQDNVWTIHRPDTVETNFKAADLNLGTCCKVAPPILEYNQAGKLINSWGGPGPGYDWPDSNHGITIDHKGNVWDRRKRDQRHPGPQVHQHWEIPYAIGKAWGPQRKQRHGEFLAGDEDLR